MGKRALVLLLSVAIWLPAISAGASAGPGKALPPKSGFYDFAKIENETGIGTLSNVTCTVSAETQDAVYAGNMLVDCDGEWPHNETSIVVNPANAAHAVGGYHSYKLDLQTGIARVTSTASVTTDSGQTWRLVTPPITPYQFTGDPALAFGANGRLYFASIADHEGPGGPFTAPSVVVQASDDGGFTWSNPVTVAKGERAVTFGFSSFVFQDKEFVAADTNSGRAYVTWTSFQEVFQERGTGLALASFRAPIMLSFSDDGVNWSAPQEISGFSPACATQFFGGSPNACEENQFSIPAVAPNGRLYVAFENFNTPAENQYMVVRSDDGGVSFSGPVRVDTVFDVNYPDNVDGRNTLTGCQLRVNSGGNIAPDPTDPSGNTAYLVWTDNRNGTATKTNVDVFLARSTDGGQTWRVHNIDSARNDQFYPWAAVGPDGTVHVGYMDRSYSSGQNVCQYGFSLSRVKFGKSGKPSIAKVRVDTALSDPGRSRWFSATTNGNSRFIGDYNGVAVGSDGAAWSLWTDQRALVANPPSPTRTHGQHAVGDRTP